MTTDNAGEPHSANLLDPVETRVLAVLAEKEALTPDNYPLSLNAIVTGSNQLSSRDPIMQLTEDQVQDALQQLMERKLVSCITQAGARVAKYEHRMRIKWTLEQDKVAILAVLMLRGPQTAGEVRTRTGRLHEFKSVAEVERSPGTKEPRYGHLLGGEIEMPEGGFAPASAPAGGGRVAQLEQELAVLRDEVEALKAQFESFRKQFE
jgi:uncharacterized protein YceH (UPF0502 family)